jgi:hypothetical protein
MAVTIMHLPIKEEWFQVFFKRTTAIKLGRAG